MGHLTREEPWGTVDLDTQTGRVFVQQNWHYMWCVYPGAQGWTQQEKKRFHQLADRAIWSQWSNRLRLHVHGRTPFAASTIPVNFDVRWSLSGPAHYTVLAWKVPPGSTPTNPVWSMVWFNLKRIQLSSADLLPRSAMNDAGKSTSDFQTVPHEFGHMLGNLLDEYNAPWRAIPNSHLADTRSIMNVGRKVRGRHLQLLGGALHTLVPSATFRP